MVIPNVDWSMVNIKWKWSLMAERMSGHRLPGKKLNIMNSNPCTYKYAEIALPENF